MTGFEEERRRHKAEIREMILEHIQNVSKFDRARVANIIAKTFEDPETTVQELTDFIHEARMQILNLAVPDGDTPEERIKTFLNVEGQDHANQG